MATKPVSLPRLLGLLFLLFWSGFVLASVVAGDEVPPQADQGPEVRIFNAHAAQFDLHEVARAVPMGGKFRVEGVSWDGPPESLELDRFNVFAPDAQLVVDGTKTIAPPRTAYFRGQVEGRPETLAVLSVNEAGDRVLGIITDPRGVWLLFRRDGQLVSQKAEMVAGTFAKPFTCTARPVPDGAGALAVAEDLASSLALEEPLTAAVAASYTARVAIETDYEFFSIFGSEQAATAYIGDLIAYASSIYQREVNTNLQVGYSRLWTQGGASDPWNANSNPGAVLDEFQSYWNTNMGGVGRTIAHFLSGKTLGGGVAYVGVLCDQQWGYGVSTNLTGGFNINAPSSVWDIIATSHEIGHNFDSPHTHCYANLGGNPSQVDHCWSGEVSNPGTTCYSGPTSLPGLDSTSGGSPGTGAGTIMSYCHQLQGGYANITLTFGDGHAYGVAPERVPSRMRDHVISTYQAFPSCLQPSNQADFVVSSISLNPSSPAPGSSFSATINVQNQGGVAGEAGWLDLWLNQSTSRNCGEQGDARVAIGQLAAGASQNVTFNNLTAGTVGGKTLRTFVDSACVTTESNEANNQSTQSYSVGGGGQPDFVVTSISLSPTSPTAGGTFNATIRVQNQGGVAGDGGYLDVWLNQPSSQGCGADGDGWAAVGTLAPGETRDFSASNMPAGTAGSKTFRVYIDSQCQTAESNEANNQLTQSYNVGGGGQPDFVVTSISPSPASPTAGGTFNATVTVQNQGNVAADGGYVDIWLNQSATQGCGADGDYYGVVGTLAAGESKNFLVEGAAAGTAGTKTLRAFVDSACSTTESNESNNQSIQSYNVGGGGQPDFVVTSISPSPASPTAGGTFNATVTVQNQGNAAGDGGYVDIWLNQSVTQGCGADGDYYGVVGTLAAGESKNFLVEGAAAGTAGTKTLRAFVDSACITTESNEGNNQTTKVYSVQSVGTGGTDFDFDGDGQADILWRNSATGENWMYLMDGTDIQGSQPVNTVSNLNWKIVGVGDFDGDAKADILWRNSATGENWMYLMNGANIQGSQPLNTVSNLNWKIVGVGDFDGDDKADILWRNSATGENWMYLMNGASIQGSHPIDTVSNLDWQIVGVGDFDGNAKADILWRNSATGENWMYLMNGSSIQGSHPIDTVSNLDWRIVGVGDFDGNAKADILWRNSATGENWMYLMNGAVIQSSHAVNSVADLNWRIVPW